MHDKTLTEEIALPTSVQREKPGIGDEKKPLITFASGASFTALNAGQSHAYM